MSHKKSYGLSTFAFVVGLCLFASAIASVAAVAVAEDVVLRLVCLAHSLLSVLGAIAIDHSYSKGVEDKGVDDKTR